MMREIKFRSWLKLKNEFIYDFVLDVPTVSECDKRVLQQYVGLKDKKGVEIFEGDIVKNVGPHSPTIRKYGFGEFRYDNEILVVCKELVGTTLRHINDFKKQSESPNGLIGMSPNGWHGPKPPIDNEQFWAFQNSFEVIGNIFENRELLEEKTHD